MPSTILTVEDDQDLLTVLTDSLQSAGYLVATATTGAAALSYLDQTQPHLVLLDLGLPDLTGETILHRLRQLYPDLPVIILTAKSAVSAIVHGLNLGADDYLPKPFALEELLARVKARLRQSLSSPAIYRIADLTLNTRTHEVFRGQQLIKLTKTEFKLLCYLLQHPNQVISRETLLNHVWGYDSTTASRAVDVYIGYLRRKICRGRKIKLINNLHGIGYIIRNPQTAAGRGLRPARVAGAAGKL